MLCQAQKLGVVGLVGYHQLWPHAPTQLLGQMIPLLIHLLIKINKSVNHFYTYAYCMKLDIIHFPFGKYPKKAMPDI